MEQFSAAIQTIALYAVPLLLSVTLHELAHGFVAWKLGDPTARAAGRLTLNPIRHLDVTGTLVFIITSWIGGFVIGWAKPVPVDPRYFRDPRRDMMLVSVAGPATNFLLALVFGLIIVFGYPLVAEMQQGVVAEGLFTVIRMCFAGVFLNVALGIFNLLPVPPLDGSKILAGLLPRSLAYEFMKIERYGMLFILLLVGSGVLGRIISPVFNWVRTLLLQ